MGKASIRRKFRRQKYLAGLAKSNPAEFRNQWTKRLVSWAVEAKRRAGLLVDENGAPAPAAFDLVTQSLEELSCCGREAIDLEEAETKEFMTDTCCVAVAKSIDPHMYQFKHAILLGKPKPRC